MKKRFLTIFTALCTILATIPASAIAAAENENNQMDVAAQTYKSKSNNDALFFEYLKKLAGVPVSDKVGKAILTGDIAALQSSTTAGDTLNGLSKKVYDLLKEEIIKVAAGECNSTIFNFSLEQLGWADLSWTPEELGVEVVTDSYNNYTQETWNAIIAAIYAETGLDGQWGEIAQNKLLVDCPYELYWYQKDGSGTLAATEWSFQGSFTRENNRISFTPDSYMSVILLVSESYAESIDETQYDPYSVDKELAMQAAAIAENAKRIVDENSTKSDYEKLLAYKTAICNLTSYNTNAATNGTTLSGIDPWQLIWVFDNDPSTNVVCEGYAKAFQYLCELSTFQGDVVSYLISGDLTGRSGSEGHMWNHVKINGQYWLVDLTNCDAGTVGYPDKLFLKAPYQRTEGNSSYAFTNNGDTLLYYTNIENYYDDDNILNLADEDYSPSSAPNQSKIQINSIWLEDSAGNILDAIPADVFSITLSISDYDSDNNTIFVTFYTDDGKFQGVKVIKEFADETISLAVDNSSGNISEIKAFALSNLIPTGQSVCFPQS